MKDLEELMVFGYYKSLLNKKLSSEGFDSVSTFCLGTILLTKVNAPIQIYCRDHFIILAGILENLERFRLIMLLVIFLLLLADTIFTQWQYDRKENTEKKPIKKQKVIFSSFYWVNSHSSSSYWLLDLIVDLKFMTHASLVSMVHSWSQREIWDRVVLKKWKQHRLHVYCLVIILI